MPIPLIIVILSVLAGAAGATVVVTNWDSITKMWRGKRLAVLGVEASGKTVLIKFLTGGVISDCYEPTQTAQKTLADNYLLEDLSLKIARSKDVPGSSIAFDQWKEVVKSADVVLYLIRSDLLLAGDDYTLERIKRDTGLLRRVLLNGSKEKKCFIIATWADKIPGYRELKGDGFGDLRRKFTEHPAMKDAVSRLRTEQSPIVPVIVGSQERTADQQKLVRSLLDSLTSD